MTLEHVIYAMAFFQVWTFMWVIGTRRTLIALMDALHRRLPR